VTYGVSQAGLPLKRLKEIVSLVDVTISKSCNGSENDPDTNYKREADSDSLNSESRQTWQKDDSTGTFNPKVNNR
jgi:hypothetical protein